MLSVIEAIRTTAASNAIAPAIIGPGRYLTYGDLLEKIARISNFLADRDVPARAKVFLNFADADLRFIATLGCLHYGLIPFVLTEIGDAAEDVDYDFVVGAPTLPYSAEVPIDLGIDPALLEGKLGDPRLRTFPDIGDDEILLIAGTTGTTGRKKLVAELGSVFAARNGRERGEFRAGDRVLVAIGDASKYGTGLGLRLLFKGAAIVRAGPNLADTLKLINMFAVNKLVATPAAVEEIIGGMTQAGVRCPSIASISVTGSLFQRQFLQKVEQAFDAEVFVNYGSSEVGIISRGRIEAASFETGYVGEVQPGVTLVSAGTADAPAPITIVNDQSRFCNYYSRGKVIKNTSPFYTLPDIGYVKDGGVYLIGRDDEVFNASGNKVAFSVIEAALRDVPGVEDVGMAGGGPIGDAAALVIAVVATDGFDLQQAMGVVTATIHGPSDLIRMFRSDAIPRNATGKVDRKALLSAYVSAKERAAAVL